MHGGDLLREMSVAYHCLQFAGVLNSLLKPCFGPNGLDVLLEGSDGHVFGASSCLQLLTSLHLSHPAGILLATAIKQHHNATGDGCKKFLLLVTEILKNIYDHHYSASSQYQRYFIEISHAVKYLYSEFNDTLMIKLTGQANGMCCSLQPADYMGIKLMCSKIINTCLGTGSSYSVKIKLREILMVLLFPEAMEREIVLQHMKRSLHVTDRRILRNGSYSSVCCSRLDELTVFQTGSSVCDSKVYPGFLIERDFIVEPTEKLRCFRMLLMYPGLGMEVDGQEIMRLKSKPHLSQTMAFFTGYTERVVKYTKRHNISMIVCGGQISAEAAQFLREHNIAAIQMVPEEMLRVIGDYCGAVPLTNTLDLAKQCDRNFWTEGISCDYVRHRRIIHLQCVSSNQGNNLPQYMPCGVLLCAPTTGYCKQLVTILRNTLRVVDTWCQTDENGCLVSVCGGGVWEIQLSREIECFLTENNIVKNTPLWIASNSVQKGLHAIPSQLVHQNPTTKVIKEIVSTQKGVLKGLDSISNSLQTVQDPSTWPAWEPLWLQHQLILSVCEFISQLLRIDQVLSVHGTLKENNVSHHKIEEEDTD